MTKPEMLNKKMLKMKMQRMRRVVNTMKTWKFVLGMYQQNLEIDHKVV
jgi:hypothetical protein